MQEIGTRSARIRSLDRTLVAIPNAEFSNLKLENFAKLDRMRLFAMIGVRCEIFLPDFPPERIAAIENTLAYPVEGSPEHRATG